MGFINARVDDGDVHIQGSGYPIDGHEAAKCAAHALDARRHGLSNNADDSIRFDGQDRRIVLNLRQTPRGNHCGESPESGSIDLPDTQSVLLRQTLRLACGVESRAELNDISVWGRFRAAREWSERGLRK
jgi:hypothetical protein